jgi:hypothetical protein
LYYFICWQCDLLKHELYETYWQCELLKYLNEHIKS